MSGASAAPRSGASHLNWPGHGFPGGSGQQIVTPFVMVGHNSNEPDSGAALVVALRLGSAGRARPQPATIPPTEAASRFLGWLRDHGCGLMVGDHESSSLLGLFEWFCHEQNLTRTEWKQLLELIAESPSVTKSRRRAYDACGELTARPIIYSVASHESMAATKPARKPRTITKSKPTADMRPLRKAA
jgi:hypothetical protein